jgi:hypothetical protein
MEGVIWWIIRAALRFIAVCCAIWDLQVCLTVCSRWNSGPKAVLIPIIERSV